MVDIAKPVVVGVTTTVPFTGSAACTFMAVTAGTITITDANGTVLLNAFPVAAGSWLELDMFVGVNGGTITTAGGASGTLTVA